MKRKGFLTLIMGVAWTLPAYGQLNLFYDVRPTLADIEAPAPPYMASDSLTLYCYPGYCLGQPYPLYNGGGQGDGQMIFVSPKLEDVTDYTGYGPPDGIDEHLCSWNPAVDWSTARFYLHAEFVGAAGEMISSIGVDQDVLPAAFATGGGYYLRCNLTTTVPTAPLWATTSVTPGPCGAHTEISLQQPTYGPPRHFYSGDSVQLGCVDIEGEYRNGENMVGTWGLRLSINSFLCLRQSPPGVPGPVLPVNFGYASGSPEAGGPGSLVGTTSPTNDMTIVVVRKGDFDLDGAACTSYDDFAWYDIALYYSSDLDNCNPFEMYLADFDEDGLPATSLDDFEYYKHAFMP